MSPARQAQCRKVRRFGKRKLGPYQLLMSSVLNGRSQELWRKRTQRERNRPFRPPQRSTAFRLKARVSWRFSRGSGAAETVMREVVGGGKGTPIQPSLFLLLFLNALQMAPCSCARDRRATRPDDQRQGRGAVVHPPRSDRVRLATTIRR